MCITYILALHVNSDRLLDCKKFISNLPQKLCQKNFLCKTIHREIGLICMSFILIVMQIIKIFLKDRQIQQLQLNISENNSRPNSLDIIVPGAIIGDGDRKRALILLLGLSP